MGILVDRLRACWRAARRDGETDELYRALGHERMATARLVKERDDWWDYGVELANIAKSDRRAATLFRARVRLLLQLERRADDLTDQENARRFEMFRAKNAALAAQLADLQAKLSARD